MFDREINLMMTKQIQEYKNYNNADYRRKAKADHCPPWCKEAEDARERESRAGSDIFGRGERVGSRPATGGKTTRAYHKPETNKRSKLASSTPSWLFWVGRHDPNTVNSTKKRGKITKKSRKTEVQQYHNNTRKRNTVNTIIRHTYSSSRASYTSTVLYPQVSSHKRDVS